MNPRVVAGVALGVAVLGGGAWYALRAAAPAHTGGLCEGTPPPEVADLCAVQAAIDRTHGGDVEGARVACDAITSHTWQGECHFQVAEALADGGKLQTALSACTDAGEYARMCRGHALWISAEDLVDATPADAAAQEQVDAFIRGLPTTPVAPSVAAPDADVAARDLADLARSAAWHGIYAGSGSADPAAAKSAGAEDARYALRAFAWEATRLLGNNLGTNALIAQVQGIWAGTVPAPHGSTQTQACWDTRMMPRSEMETALWLPSVRTYPGNASFYDDDPANDLIIAVLDAAWVHGMTHDADALLALRASPSTAVQKTIARQLGFIAEQSPQAGHAYPKKDTSQADLRKIYKMTRMAARNSDSGRSVVSNRLGTCK